MKDRAELGVTSTDTRPDGVVLNFSRTLSV